MLFCFGTNSMLLFYYSLFAAAIAQNATTEIQSYFLKFFKKEQDY